MWDYAGVNTLQRERREELAMHPTVKPVALVADAIKDCSRRGEIMLDPFGGAGTTLIAAEKTGRQARLIEFDPAYCDQTLQRFEQLTGKKARLAAAGQSFEEVAEGRRTGSVQAPAASITAGRAMTAGPSEDYPGAQWETMLCSSRRFRPFGVAKSRLRPTATAPPSAQ